MTPSALEAGAVLADRHTLRRNVVPDGEARVAANRRDLGIGFFASVRFGRNVRFFSGIDRADALRQAHDFARNSGLRVAS